MHNIDPQTDENSRIPVLVVSGFLGSGKTTLLNRILKISAFAGSAVIINEFGEEPLDHHLVESVDDGIIELSNGCICCSVRGQLSDTLQMLSKKKLPAIIVETTGIANPRPVLQSIVAVSQTLPNLYLAGLVTVFDAINGHMMVERHEEAHQQLTLADVIIRSKLDLYKNSNAETDGSSDNNLKSINSIAKIYGADDFINLIEQKGLGQLLDQISSTFEPSLDTTSKADNSTGKLGHTHRHLLKATTLRSPTPLKAIDLEMFLDLLVSAHGNHITRLKGLVRIDDNEHPLLVEIAGNSVSPPRFLKSWPKDMEPQSIITVFLDGIEPQFIQDLFNGFTGMPAIDSADKQAMSENPLAIDGIHFKSGSDFNIGKK